MEIAGAARFIEDAAAFLLHLTGRPALEERGGNVVPDDEVGKTFAEFAQFHAGVAVGLAVAGASCFAKEQVGHRPEVAVGAEGVMDAEFCAPGQEAAVGWQDDLTEAFHRIDGAAVVGHVPAAEHHPGKPARGEGFR